MARCKSEGARGGVLPDRQMFWMVRRDAVGTGVVVMLEQRGHGARAAAESDP